ncbi:MAG: toll/interleukin-1 receptor domain-containing protein [Planctomycetia bacterium]|nr:toll/interleukin-1 receptor domain-containing protein [Planctomycetia bacterium]
MSLSTIQSSLDSLNRELVQLQKSLQDNTKKIEEEYKKIERIQRSFTSSTISHSMMKSKASELERYQKSILEFQKKGKNLEKKIADKKAQIARKNAEFQAEQRIQFKRVTKLEQEEQKRQQENNAQTQKLLQSMRSPGVRVSQHFLPGTPGQIHLEMSIPVGTQQDSKTTEENTVLPQYDFFISHASEDKESIAKPLYEFLTKKGAKVWYDDFTLTIGDSLRKSIDKGLISSRFGIVIFSEHFFKKSWPQYELDGLVQKRMKEDKAILPIWHNISLDTMQRYSPSLCDIIALKTSDLPVEEIGTQLMGLLQEDE